MALHWVERETFQVLSLTSSFLPVFFSLLLPGCLLLSLAQSVLLRSMPGLIRNQVSLCQTLEFYANECLENNVPQTGRLLLHMANFNLLLSILRVL